MSFTFSPFLRKMNCINDNKLLIQFVVILSVLLKIHHNFQSHQLSLVKTTANITRILSISLSEKSNKILSKVFQQSNKRPHTCSKAHYEILKSNKINGNYIHKQRLKTLNSSVEFPIDPHQVTALTDVNWGP